MFESVDKEYIRVLIIGGMIFTIIGTISSIFLLFSIILKFLLILDDILLFLTLCVFFNGLGLASISVALWRLIRPK